jgi:hypothetical protein
VTQVYSVVEVTVTGMKDEAWRCDKRKGPHTVSREAIVCRHYDSPSSVKTGAVFAKVAVQAGDHVGPQSLTALTASSNSTYFGEGPTSRFHHNLPPDSACFSLERGRDIQDYGLSALCPSSGISKYKKTKRLGNWICFRPQARGGTHTLLGPFGKN